MNAKLLGFFSGFPSRRFPAPIARRLSDVLTVRDLLVFISAWPSDAAQNDSDAVGMHAMFAQYDMPFRKFCVIDRRTGISKAQSMIRAASCIFLMGGNATEQFRLICEKELLADIRASSAVILGVSAGSSNMAVRALDIWESHDPYPGLGLADLTIKAHASPENTALMQTLLGISSGHDLPICAMQDDSAIFIQDGKISCIGSIHWVYNAKITAFSPDLLRTR